MIKNYGSIFLYKETMCTCLVTEFTMHDVLLAGKFTEKLMSMFCIL
jgi:hypothetical protein